MTQTPKDATHQGADGRFYRVEQERWFYLSAFGFWQLHFSGRPIGATPITAESSAPAWNGEGLPPVGLEVEFLNYRKEWIRVTIFAHKFGEVLFELSNGWGNADDAKRFRPIRTAEQIAAEERSKTCDKMYGEVLNRVPQERRNNGSDVCEALYDAGYRKVEQ